LEDHFSADYARRLFALAHEAEEPKLSASLIWSYQPRELPLVVKACQRLEEEEKARLKRLKDSTG
jgi:hypothetical protein